MCGFAGMILFLFSLFTSIHFGNSNDPGCCDVIPASEVPCRDLCNQFFMTESQAEQLALVSQAPAHCPKHSMELWTCTLKSLPVLADLGTFSGRPCCNLTKTRACREACIKAESESDVEQHCSRSTEDSKLYDCISRQKEGEKCCGKAIRPDSLMCKATCWNIYLSDTLTSSESKRQLRQQCTGRNKDVVHCLQRQTRSPRQSTKTLDSLDCCESPDTSSECKKVCRSALTNNSLSEDNKLAQIIDACGIDLMDPLFICLLKKDNSAMQDTSAMDLAKLHCCNKAKNPRCGSLCIKSNSNKWAMNKKFEKYCGTLSSQPASGLEVDMLSCLKDVEEPCHLGCSGLHYCTNMNNRPTELFRSCTPEADMAARNDILLWQNGTISLPESLTIPVKDIMTCEPEMWKAIACTYQIKPCFRTPSLPQICQEDCVYITNKCVDTRRLDGKKVKELCNRLPKTSSGKCISLKDYTSESDYRHKQNEITHPCKPNPCQEDEMCLIHRRKCRHPKGCPNHVCRPACKMGQLSRVYVPQNTNVIVPVFRDQDTKSSCAQYKVCHCSHSGDLDDCKNLSCQEREKCPISVGVLKSHGEHFQYDCNNCTCYNGEQICTRKQCQAPQQVGNNYPIDIKNCNCYRSYEPVCGANGKTYPSSCIAKCAGETEWLKGSCYEQDPCQSMPCEKGFKCIPYKQVCFGRHGKSCDQYKCVSVSECNSHKHEPVCGECGVEYTNACILLSKGKSLAYQGHCVLKECSNTGAVCGHDGETYNNECTALAARTTVDYNGVCKRLGLNYIDEMHLTQVCADVECKPVNPPGCKGIIPPWSCCPVCAAELRILASDTVEQFTEVVMKQGPITLGNILETLSTMLTVLECDVFGYLSLDGDIVVLIAPTTQVPTPLQVTACTKEAERLQYLIESRSHMFTSNVILTPLLYAPLRAPVITLSSGASTYTRLSVTLTLTIVTITCFIHKILKDL